MYRNYRGSIGHYRSGVLSELSREYRMLSELSGLKTRSVPIGVIGAVSGLSGPLLSAKVEERSKIGRKGRKEYYEIVDRYVFSG